MPVVINSKVQEFSLPGLVHQTIAGKEFGAKNMEVWMQTIAPAGATPVHYHLCEEIVVILRGSGQAMIGDENINFEPNSTIIFPPNVLHQIVNTGAEELFLIATLGEIPARVYTADGNLLKLPWQSL